MDHSRGDEGRLTGQLLPIGATIGGMGRLLETRAAIRVSQSSGSGAKARQSPERKPSNCIPDWVQQQLFGEFGVEVRRLDASTEFPTALTRIPLFMPGRREQQMELLKECSLSFCTPWGRGKRHGPPLTTDDEDTLMAILRLRRFALRGAGARLPVPIAGDTAEQTVHAVYLRISQLQRELGVDAGGRANDLRLESIKRLAATRVEFEALAGDGTVCGTTHSLLEVQWKTWRGDGVILVQFSPVISRMLEEAYSYIDWNIRRQLSPVGKAIHRFLSGQGRCYSIGAEKLQSTIGCHRPFGKYMQELRRAMDRLQSLGWIKNYDLSGNGRSVPFVLRVAR
jgi:hypothetical protein